VGQLAQTLGRPPSDPELAAFLDMDLSKLQALFGEAHSLNVVHLDELLAGGEEGLALSSEAGFDRDFERQEIKAALSRELQQLPERERLILSLYYDEELTLKEIGQVLKLTESRISQILSSTLLKLRALLNGSASPRKARKQA
jgi:RNA polymerase sigma factor for flagellar operon FliA